MSAGAGAVCVFCGAKPDVEEVYLEAARAFGELLASEGSAVVFGGGCIGMMGALADGAIAAGGSVSQVFRLQRIRQVDHFYYALVFVFDRCSIYPPEPEAHVVGTLSALPLREDDRGRFSRS